MEPLAIPTAGFAAILVATRIPLLVAPAASRDVVLRLLERPAAVRGLGAVMAVLGASFVATALPARAAHGLLATGLGGLGWILAAVAVWLLLAPGSYARVARSLLESVRDAAALRVLGVAGIAVGLGFAWLALRLA